VVSSWPAHTNPDIGGRAIPRPHAALPQAHAAERTTGAAPASDAARQIVISVS